MGKSLKCTIKMKWWFSYLYLPGLITVEFLVRTFINIHAEVDTEKLQRMAMKAMTIRFDRET
jgi:hypothetical protein